MRMLVSLLVALLHSLLALFRSREEQAMVEMALRQQLSIYTQQQRRPRTPRKVDPRHAEPYGGHDSRCWTGAGHDDPES